MAITFEELATLAVTKKASDLHLVVGEPPVLRIEGVLEVQTDLPAVTGEDSQKIFASITTPDQQRILNENRELDFGYASQDGAHFRINLHWERGVIGLVARLIAPNIPTLKDLFMPDICQNILYVKQGLIIMTGPTGSGKSSSLAAMIDYVNEERAEHIVTFEDPIEFIFKPKKSIIRQRQIGSDVLSFAEGLKHVLRQDPNVIMVGEIRDLDTMSAVLTLAETGHLVLATLHAPNSVQAIDRIINLFPPHQQEQARLSLASVLTAVITKLLIPRVSGGRIPAYEVLINTQPVAGLIRDNKISQIKSFLETSSNQGMITMEQAFQQLLKTGEINQETFNASGQ